MRIGQILLEADLITAKQLSEGLEYGTAKSIFLGKVMKLLKYVEEENVERALEAQKLIKMGLSPVLAIGALKRAIKENITLEQALQNEHLDTLNVDAYPGKTRAADLKLAEDDAPESLIKNGDALLVQDCCAEALAQYIKARSKLEQSLGVDHIDLTPVLARLGNTFLSVNSFAKARECYEKVLTITLRALPDDSPQIARAQESLGDLFNAQGDGAQAIEYFLAALDILEKKLPAQLGFYASILRKLTKCSHDPRGVQSKNLPVGELLKAAGLLTDRELQTALRMSKQTSQPLGVVLRENCMIGDRELQSALKAQFCVKQGVLSEQIAVNLLSRASRRDISLERLLHEAGVLMSDEEKFELYRQIAAELDKLVAAESSSVNTKQELAPIAYRLGSLYEQVGDHSQAEVYYSRSLSIWGTANAGDLTVAKACESLSKIFQGQNRHEETLPLLTKALEHRQHALGPNHQETIETLENLAEVELEAQEYQDALEHTKQAIATREELGETGATLLRSVVLLGDCMVQLKQFDGAQAAYNRAMTIARTGESQPTPALAAVMEKLGDLYSKQGLNKVASPLYKGALMILEGAGKKESKKYEFLQEKIAKSES